MSHVRSVVRSDSVRATLGQKATLDDTDWSFCEVPHIHALRNAFDFSVRISSLSIPSMVAS